jgi:Gluconate 2-dehydrogenase subunit 3
MPTRREMLQRIVAAIGAGAAVPGLSAQDHFGRHLANTAALEQADAKAKARAYKPEFLDQHQFETLQSLAERIIPGVSRANTSEFIDQLLAVDAREDQRDFLTALGAFEGQALARGGRPWKQLAEADQIAILTNGSTMMSGRPAERFWTKGDPIQAPPPTGPVKLTLRDHFDLLKSWVAGAYYSSEIGMRELGWTGNVVHATFPGCDHPGGHR